MASVVRITKLSSPMASARMKKTLSSGRRHVMPSTNEVTTMAQRPVALLAALAHVGFCIQPSKTQCVPRRRATPKVLVSSESASRF